MTSSPNSYQMQSHSGTHILKCLSYFQKYGRNVQKQSKSLNSLLCAVQGSPLFKKHLILKIKEQTIHTISLNSKMP